MYIAAPLRGYRKIDITMFHQNSYLIRILQHDRERDLHSLDAHYERAARRQASSGPSRLKRLGAGIRNLVHRLAAGMVRPAQEAE